MCFHNDIDLICTRVAALDPETEMWRMKLLRILYLEVLHFLLYNVALFAVRIPVVRRRAVVCV